MQLKFPHALFGGAVSKRIELPTIRRETLAWLTLLIMQQLCEEGKQEYEKQLDDGCSQSECDHRVNRLPLKLTRRIYHLPRGSQERR